MDFIPCDLPGLESRAAKSDGVTDLYLADLASRRGMTLATLDTGIAYPPVEIVGL